MAAPPKKQTLREALLLLTNWFVPAEKPRG